MSVINTERSPSRRTASSPTALAVSNGSAAHRRLRSAFSPPQRLPTKRKDFFVTHQNSKKMAAAGATGAVEDAIYDPMNVRQNMIAVNYW